MLIRVGTVARVRAGSDCLPWQRVVHSLLLVTALLPGFCTSALADQSLADLSLEQLLDVQLFSMGITGIHHGHHAGEWMVGYESRYIDKGGNRDGTRGVTPTEVMAEGFAVSPISMNIEMHMLHFMYGVTDQLTLAIMAPVVRKSMKHVTQGGQRFTTRSEGLGDLQVGALVGVFEHHRHRLTLEAGLSLPTGSIDEKDNTAMSGGEEMRLPYPMQLGSGTFDFLPGLTYLGQSQDWAWGTRADGTLRLGENDNDYRLGHRLRMTTWVSRALAPWLSVSLRLEGQDWGNVHGADSELNPAAAPTADPSRRAGQRVDVLFGANVFTISGPLAGARFSLEGGLPIYERLDGPQLETNWRIGASLEWTLF